MERWYVPLERGEHREGCRNLRTRSHTSQGRTGICIVKTKQAMLLAHYPETVQPGSAANVVEQLADYMIGVGY